MTSDVSSRPAGERCHPALSCCGGFTLLETVIAVSVTLTLFLLVLPAGLRLMRWANLDSSTKSLTWELRYAQEAAQSTGQSAIVRLFPYTPQYWTYVGGQVVRTHTFAPDVMYKDGYLQLGTGMITYDLLGNAQVGGVIRLVIGPDERDIRLYIGAGLQTEGGTQ